MRVAFISIHQNGSRINENQDLKTSTQLSLVLHDFFVILGAVVFCSVQVKNFLQYIFIILLYINSLLSILLLFLFLFLILLLIIIIIYIIIIVIVIIIIIIIIIITIIIIIIIIIIIVVVVVVVVVVVFK